MDDPEKPIIIIIDDDKIHRENLKWNLENGFEYKVVDYRDLKNFKDDLNKNKYLSERKVLFILDIMFAQELDENLMDAPILIDNNCSDEEKKRFREDDLGIGVVTDIREDNFKKYGISKEVPVIFFTCLQNIDVIEATKHLKAIYLTKPQPIIHVQAAIEKLLSKNK